MSDEKKPCDCNRCDERDSIAVIAEEIDYQMGKRPNPLPAYAIVILKKILDGIKNPPDISGEA